MKYKIKEFFIKIILLFVLFILPFSIYCKDISKAKNINTIIKINNLLFDEKDLMKIYDQNKNMIAYFDRGENINFNVKSIKIFDLDKKLKYIIVPIFSMQSGETNFYIKDENDITNQITYKNFIKDNSLNYEIVVDFLNKNYTYNYEEKINGKYNYKKIKGKRIIRKASINYDNKQVIYFEQTFSMKGIEYSNYMIDIEYLNNNKLEAALFILCLFLYDEVATDIAKLNRQ